MSHPTSSYPESSVHSLEGATSSRWRTRLVILRESTLRARNLILSRFVSLVGHLSSPGQKPSGALQGWALRRMGVDCPSNEIWIGGGTSIDNPRRLKLGRRISIGAGSRITGYKADVIIGDDFMSAPGLFINTGTHDITTYAPVYRTVRIGDGVWCGTRVTIGCGVHVGADCIIGAGSVVLRSLPARHVAVGVPCKPLRKVTPMAPLDRWGNFHTSPYAATGPDDVA